MPKNAKIYLYVGVAGVLIGILVVLLFAFSGTGSVTPLEQAFVPTSLPQPRVTPTPSPSRTPLHIATPAALPTDNPPAAPPSTSSPTTNSGDVNATATGSPAATTPLPTATGRAVTADGDTPTLTSVPSTYPALVTVAPLPLAQSEPGTWQGQADGSTRYVLPEGAVEGEALGALVGATLPLQLAIQSGGEDCGAAIGSPSNFALIRLREADGGDTSVLLDNWQRDNFTTPPPQVATNIKATADGWHKMALSIGVDNTLTYTVDETVRSTSGSLPTPAQVYLYAGGSGCQYRMLP